MSKPETPRHTDFQTTMPVDPVQREGMVNPLLDATHEPALRSWVETANEGTTDFPLQNLPYGRFRRLGSKDAWRIGVAIGTEILDLHLASTQCPWPEAIEELLAPLAAGDLDTFMALGPQSWRVLRHALSIALSEGSDLGPFLELCLLPQSMAEMSLPCRIGEFTDFYAGIHHATAVGKLYRPEQPAAAQLQVGAASPTTAAPRRSASAASASRARRARSRDRASSRCTARRSGSGSSWSWAR